jgi:hypothetical protein
MNENSFEPLLMEMQTLSQKYALGKMARRRFEDQLKTLQEKLSSEAMAGRIKSERRSAFYNGFIAAFVFSGILYFLFKLIQTGALARYWG